MLKTELGANIPVKSLKLEVFVSKIVESVSQDEGDDKNPKTTLATATAQLQQRFKVHVKEKVCWCFRTV